MKVAYLVNQYPRTSHSFIRREIKALEAEGLEVDRFSLRPLEGTLVTPDDVEELARTRVVLGGGVVGLVSALVRELLCQPIRWGRALARSVRLGWGSERGVLRHLAYLGEACVVLGWCRASGVEHLHVHFGTNGAVVALLIRELGGPGYSLTVHGPREFDSPEDLRLREKVGGSAFAVAVSSFGRSQLFRWARVQDWSKIHVVRCGLEPELLAAAPRPIPEEPRLVCVGRLCEQKGHLLLIEAAARLAREGLRFELSLVGDGPLRADIETRVRRERIADRVKFAGWLGAPDVREAILASRALVLPSFAEGLPVVLMEALALRRPVITTAIAGIPELVEDGVHGWLIPAGSVDELVGAMRSAIVSPTAELEHMGDAGSRRVAELHDVRTEARKLVQLFRDCAPCAGPGVRRSRTVSSL